MNQATTIIPTEDDFRAYEKVRQGGKFNMRDPRAQQLSGLDKDTYMAVLDQYFELNARYPHVREEVRAEQND